MRALLALCGCCGTRVPQLSRPTASYSTLQHPTSTQCPLPAQRAHALVGTAYQPLTSLPRSRGITMGLPLCPFTLGCAGGGAAAGCGEGRRHAGRAVRGGRDALPGRCVRGLACVLAPLARVDTRHSAGRGFACQGTRSVALRPVPQHLVDLHSPRTPCVRKFVWTVYIRLWAQGHMHGHLRHPLALFPESDWPRLPLLCPPLAPQVTSRQPWPPSPPYRRTHER